MFNEIKLLEVLANLYSKEKNIEREKILFVDFTAWLDENIQETRKDLKELDKFATNC